MNQVMIHYLHETSDGPIHSGPAGVSDPHGVLQAVGVDLSPKRLRFACNPTAVMSDYHRGTNACHKGAQDRFIVTCPKCLESDAFKKAAAEWDELNGPAVMLDAQGKKCC